MVMKKHETELKMVMRSVWTDKAPAEVLAPLYEADETNIHLKYIEFLVASVAHVEL